jgi:zinc protease|tara:strand:- start:68056 stop:70893 length:2838 start_codon:yes stop_codon:yes gene_type:complete
MNKRKASLLTLSLLGAISFLAADGPRPYAHESSDLPVDPAVTFGALENGLRYAILPNKEPPGRVSLRLLVEAGRLEEREDQIGAAHLLEHLMFNGSEHFPPGELVKLFQRLGMGFGADTNAYTGFDETVYMFELPDTNDETLEQSFLALRDYADRAFLLVEEVERERGIVLSERRDRNTAGRRSAEDAIRFMMPYATAADRVTASEGDTLALTVQDLRDFYEDWYSAEKMAVIVVGDIAPPRAAALIQKHFDDVRANEVPAPPVARGIVTDREEAYDVFVDAELASTEIDLNTIRPRDKPLDTAELRAHDVAIDAANAMLNLRLAELAQSENPPFLSATGYSYRYLGLIESTGVSAKVSDSEQWERALATIQYELRRALEFGFNESELELYVANQLTGLKRAVAQAESRESSALAQGLVDAISGDTVMMNPAQELAFYGPLFESLTTEVAQAVLSDLWAGPSRLLRIQTPEPIENLYVDMRLAFRANESVEVEPLAEVEAADFGYTDFGEAGTIVERNAIAGLDAEQIIFANNVVLSLKKTDFEKGRVRIGVRLGEGIVSMDSALEGLETYSQIAFLSGGLEKHSVIELEKIFAGSSVGISYAPEEDALTLSGVTTPEDLLLQLQYLAAYVTAPGYRPEAARRAQQSIPQLYRQLTQTLDGVFAREVPRYLAGGDPRFGYASEEAILSHDLEGLAAWLGPQLANSKLEVAVVGDIDPQAVIEAVANTFGALPERPMVKEITADRQLTMPEAGSLGEFTFATDNPKARLFVTWPTADRSDIFLTRRLSVMAGLVSERLRERVREEIGEAYSPYAYNRSNDAYPGFGYTAAVMDITADRIEPLSELLFEIGSDLVNNEIEQDEFERVLRPRITSLEEQARENPYWLYTVLLGSHEKPERLEWARTLFTDYPSITREEIAELAKAYLNPESAFRVSVVGLLRSEEEDQ